jgi:hypothetical protein
VIFSIIEAEDNLEEGFLQTQCLLVSYGDDMVKAVTEEFSRHVSPERVCYLMRIIFGMILTGVAKDGDGDYVNSLSQAEFIGRTFKLYHGLYFAPLKPTSYAKMTTWMRASKAITERESYQAVLNTMCYEAIPQGKNFYNKLLKNTEKVRTTLGIKPLYPTYGKAIQVYLDNYSNCAKGERANWFALIGTSREGLKT